MQYQADYVCPVSHFNPQIISTVDLMKNKGYLLRIVPMSRSTLQKYKGNIPDKILMGEHISHVPTASLEYLLNKYSISSPYSFVFPEMVYDRNYPGQIYNRYISSNYGKPEFEPYREQLHRTLDYFDNLYSDGFDAVHISNQGARIVRQVIQVVADYHDVQSIRYSFNPLPRRRSIRSSTEMRFPKLERALDESLDEDERRRAKKYIRSIRTNKPKFKGSPNDDKPSLRSRIGGKIQTIKTFEDNLPKAIAWEFIRPTLKSISAKLQSRWHVEQASAQSTISSENYIFYPIQYPIESRVTLRSPAFYDQKHLIKYLARNLPSASDQLVVKDHPRHVGQLSLRSAKEISENACFIDPEVSAHDIVRNADAIVTLNNTVGHEALVWEKPVVTLGDALYSQIGLTYDVENINNLDSVIAEAVEKGGPTQTKLLRYINGLYKISDPMIWGDTSEESIENIVDSITKRTV